MPDLKLMINGAEVIVPEQQVTEAVTKGELEIKADTLKVMPVADFEQLTTNLKNDEYNKGKVAGVEMSVKEQRESLGLQFEGKTIPNLLDAFKSKVLKEASIDPNKQIETLQADKTALQNQIAEWQTKYTGLEQTYQKRDIESKKFESLVSALPNDGLLFAREKVAKIIKSDLEEQGYSIDVENGATVIKKAGEVVKDSIMNPITLDKFLPDFVKPYQKTNSGGAGGGDKNNIAPGSLDAFTKEMETAGIRPGSVKYNEEMGKRIKDKTLTL